MSLGKVKNIFFKYFKVWWIPILLYLIPLMAFQLGEVLKSDSIINFSLMLFFLNIIGNIVSAIVQIVIKKWYFLIPQILISGFLFVFVSIIFTFSPPDYYGVNKEIPKDIEIYEPLEKEPTENDFGKFDLVLASSFQPGIYIYFTNYKSTEKGNFYIKAFEVTSNDHLSADRMKIKSKVNVENLESKLYSGEIMIYEGSWGDKYGARIELWFEPLNGSKDYKITERNYIVEGWMR
ncbi:hypothetical protein A8975_1364 [Meridianimaribacter flavus]|uniref:Uncharacterized protein n=2 Tax=Meridianimaribacter flavus TaxID=571115 RepID=A0ABY2G6A5_9FLAO|nr:hypothetical protein A8975_1364 [Meridianimaribacter flavus]